MSFKSPYKTFVFEGYGYDSSQKMAYFSYSFDSERYFTEKIYFDDDSQLSAGDELLGNALLLAFYVVGTSYYKAFPTRDISFKVGSPDAFQAEFLNTVYRAGLSQFIFENGLSLDDMAIFSGGGESIREVSYEPEGISLLQSGGKDSLLLAELLHEAGKNLEPVYIRSGETSPAILEDLAWPLRSMRREIDIEALQQAKDEGALNGHVPVTYIVLAYSIIDAILHGNNAVLAAIGQEGEEPHDFIEDMPVNHQWSKTWSAEKLLARYISKYISRDIEVGSPLRSLTELRIAELFVEKCWSKFGHSFSSCNRANYQQGADNSRLKWCGECPKCANSYLLFAPFVEPAELQSLFAGEDLFKKPILEETFKGLLGIDGVMKPFECVGETEELRLAYHMARARFGESDYQLPFEVPDGDFDYKKIGERQPFIDSILKIS